MHFPHGIAQWHAQAREAQDRLRVVHPEWPSIYPPDPDSESEADAEQVLAGDGDPVLEHGERT